MAPEVTRMNAMKQSKALKVRNKRIHAIIASAGLNAIVKLLCRLEIVARLLEQTTGFIRLNGPNVA